MSSIDNVEQFRQWSPPYRPDDLIEDGLLFPGAALMMFGAAGSWKTMGGIHLASCLAKGIPWFGLKTSTATVLLHQAELTKSKQKDRVFKYLNNNQGKSPNLFYYTVEDENVFVDTTVGMSLLEKHIDEVRRRAHDTSLPIVVILDPLKHYMKGHISDEYEVNKFQRNLDPIRKGKAVAFIIIHHARLTRVDGGGAVVDLGAEEIMGSSYWNNWLDTIIRLKITNPFSGSNRILTSFGKHRNSEEFHPSFTIEWSRSTLTPEVVDREIVVEDDPTIRDLT